MRHPKDEFLASGPLRVSTFRNLLVADVVSDIGTFMQNVGAAWLMASLGAGPIYVALTQTAASLPYFLLALPAGSAGDIFDRCKLVLATESWMMGITLLLVVLTTRPPENPAFTIFPSLCLRPVIRTLSSLGR
jgi:MFS family permease